MVSLLPSLMLIYIDGTPYDSTSPKGTYWDYSADGSEGWHCLSDRTKTKTADTCNEITLIANCYMYDSATTCEKCDYGYGLKADATGCI